MKAIFTFILFSTIIAAASAQAIKSPFDTTRYGQNPKVGKYLNTRGFKMYYEVYGRGEPLLIIHGNGGSIKNFMYQIPYFAKKYKVILADSRSQGKSVDPKDSLSYEMMADDLNALLDSLHLKQCYVIGWSDGGINGVLMAMRHPDKVKKLAVTGTNLWPDSTALEPFTYHLINNYASKLRDSIKRSNNPSAALKNDYKLNNMMVLQPNIKLEQLHAIKCPTLVIGGDHDVILPSHTLQIAEAIPQSYLWIIPNSGHATPIAKHDDFNRTVGEFFAAPYRQITGTARFQ